MQWLFTPLLALVALAWLCLRLKAAGTFDAIRGSVRKMSVFQRFAAAALVNLENLSPSAKLFDIICGDEGHKAGVTGMRRMSFAYGREKTLPLVF